jgi:hypothetical protein
VRNPDAGGANSLEGTIQVLAAAAGIAGACAIAGGAIPSANTTNATVVLIRIGNS